MADENKKNYETVKIPVGLYKQIEERIKGTGFTSVSSYVTYVLREIIAEDEETEEEFSEEDEERVKERLRALGYLE